MRRFVALLSALACTAVGVLGAATVLAQSYVPGTRPQSAPSERFASPAAVSAASSLAPFYSYTGLVRLSLDALGILGSTGSIHVDKPAGATVRAAYMASASTGFSGYSIPNGGITINGNPVTWSLNIPSSINSNNNLADVTSIVKPIVDAAPAGIVALTILENGSLLIDGSMLAVVFDDPSMTEAHTVGLFFGAQAIAGDTFNLALADPVPPLSDTSYVLNLSLGISFGYQTTAVTDQVSLIDVNGQRMTSSAGGMDDGQDYGAGANGSLITVGGIGDDPANPADPYGVPDIGCRYDDELYNLRPFVNPGDRNIRIVTRNPSNDDNIFFGALLVRGGFDPGDACGAFTLGPTQSTSPVRTQQCVTARALNASQIPLTNVNVTFLVTGGPQAGTTGQATTDANGEASFCYVGEVAGIDTLVASMACNDTTKFSLTVYREFVGDIPPPCDPPARVEDNTPALDLKSPGEWIGFKVGPPMNPPCLASDLHVGSFMLNDTLPSAVPAHVSSADQVEWGQHLYLVKFKRADVEAMFPNGGQQVVKISGMCEGTTSPISSPVRAPLAPACVPTEFCGTATIWIIKPRLQTPVAGQTVNPGSSFPITWELPAGQTADETSIHYSLDAGMTWTTVAEHYTGSTSYDWSVPAVEANAVVLAVETYRNGTLAGRDQSQIFQIANGTTDVSSGLPVRVYLAPPQPSPFGSSTVLRYGLPKAGTVKLSVLDITGRTVRTLVNKMQEPGNQTAIWNGQDDSGHRVEAGVYFYRLEGLGVVLSQKVVCLR